LTSLHVDAQLGNVPVSQLQQHLDSYIERLHAAGVHCVHRASVPLRPVFLDPKWLDELKTALRALRHRLGAPEVLAAAAASASAVDNAQRETDAYRSGDFLPMLRPDLRIDTHGHARLIDINAGTAAAVTAFETDLMTDLYLGMRDDGLYGPTCERLRERAIHSSFRCDHSIVDALAARVNTTGAETIFCVRPAQTRNAAEFEGQELGFVERFSRQCSVPVKLFEFPGSFDPYPDMKRPLHVVPIGQFQLNRSLHVAHLHMFLAAENVRFTSHWLDSLFEKRLLTLLSGERLSPQVSVPTTVFAPTVPDADPAAWVLKHGSNMKRVVVGAEDPVGFATALQAADSRWIIRLPFLREGRVTLVDVIPEFSPFFLDGEVVSIFVRFVDADSTSTVVSPPPPNLGLTTAWIASPV
jgi:hypothetical protein